MTKAVLGDIMSKQETKMQLKINPKYLELVPRLRIEQYQLLKESIREEGQLEPIVSNDEGVILDGHTRFQICNELKIKPISIVKRFANKDLEMRYVITVNLKRRQLNTFQRFELIEKLRNDMQEKREIQRVKDIVATRKGLKPPKSVKNHNDLNEKIAEISGLSRSQVQKSVYVKAHGSKELIEKVRLGKITVSRATMIITEERREKNIMIKPLKPVINCPKCNSVCKRTRMCHVHKGICCPKCEWGK